MPSDGGRGFRVVVLLLASAIGPALVPEGGRRGGISIITTKKKVKVYYNHIIMTMMKIIIRS